jgi:hypothetical protein
MMGLHNKGETSTENTNQEKSFRKMIESNKANNSFQAFLDTKASMNGARTADNLLHVYLSLLTKFFVI